MARSNKSNNKPKFSERSGGRPGYANTRRAEKARDQFGIKEEPAADSSSKRINLDNARVTDPRLAAFLKGMHMKDANDISWYKKNMEMFAAATAFPSADVVGSPLLRFDTNVYVPGILTLYWEPHLEGTAFTQAMDSMYTFTVHANSRNYGYNAPDQMMVIIAAAEVFRAIANANRVYGVMKRFNPLNEYMAKELVTALGFNYDDLKANLGNMWFDINQMIAACEQFWIPDNMPILERWFWLNSNIYTDANSPKAQLYAFVPASFFKLDGTIETGTSLVRETAWNPSAYINGIMLGTADGTAGRFLYGNSQAITWKNYSNMVWDMINTLANSEDRGIILGDLLNAYGANRIYKIEPISADYVIAPTYNAEVLSQIENANCIATQVSGMVQNPASYTSRTQIQYTQFDTSKYANISAVPGNTVLNFHQNTPPSGDQIMIATRLKVSGARVIKSTSDGTNMASIGPNIAGTEFISAISTWTLTVSGLRQFVWDYTRNEGAGGVTNFTGSELHDWVAFDWAPWMYIVKAVTPDFTAPGNRIVADVAQAMGDWDWYTTIDADELRKLHVTALYSLLGQPEDI